MAEQWYIREDGGAFDIMDETGAFCTCDDKKKAQLVVVAPELLESLQLLLDSYASGSNFPGRIKKAVKIIAKAKGEVS